MAGAEGPDDAGRSRAYGLDLLPWAVLVLLLVIGGLLLSARAGDSYMAASGLLFAAFGVLLGFRLLGRTLP